jgi:hypothetical protein
MERDHWEDQGVGGWTHPFNKEGALQTVTLFII